MKRNWLQILIALGVALYAAGVIGQTCSITNPCVQVAITNLKTLPSPTVFWTCMGSSCTQAALNAALVGQTATNLCPATPSVWHCNQFSQTKTPVLYNDPEPWSALMTYSSQGTSGGGVATTSALVTFQVPNAPAQQTSITGVPTMVTTGTAGPQ